MCGCGATSIGFPAEKVSGWLRDPKLAPDRHDNYAFLLGQCGKAEHAEVLRGMIERRRLLREIEATARMHLTDYQVAVAELEAIIGAEVFPLPNDPSKSKANRK